MVHWRRMLFVNEVTEREEGFLHLRVAGEGCIVIAHGIFDNAACMH